MPRQLYFAGRHSAVLFTGSDALPLVPEEWRFAESPLSSPPLGRLGLAETVTYDLKDQEAGADECPIVARAVRVTLPDCGEWAVVAVPVLKPGGYAEGVLTRAVNLAFRRYLLPMMEAKASRGGMAG